MYRARKRERERERAVQKLITSFSPVLLRSSVCSLLPPNEKQKGFIGIFFSRLFSGWCVLCVLCEL